MMDRIGKYEITRTLGKGACGTVYHAVDTFTNKEVALKVIDPEVFKDPEFGEIYRAQFLNEASLAGQLSHPYIVSILDAVVSEDAGHIAMEFVDGGDLSQHVSHDTLLPFEDVIQIAFKCCGALDYAFREGVVHRDIKPANIMFSGGSEAKIADFGSAYLRKSQAVQTATIGSPYYMSPEQVSEQPLTQHSDMFCLGVVLYELLTGRRPFTAQSIQMLTQKILDQDPVPPSQVRPDLPPEVDRVVLMALKKKPEQRYPTWSEFAMELAKLVRLGKPSAAIYDSEKFVSLNSVEMLHHLTDSAIWELVKAGQWRRVPATSVVIQENAPGQSFFFLAQGEVKVIRQGRLLNLISAGECFGEMGYIRGGDLPRQATVEAMTDVVLAEFEGAALEKMTEGCQLHFTRALVRNLVDRLALANSRLSR
jgi:serine/threonine protein kinase